MPQQFKTNDVLRLEVEQDPAGLSNLVPNPSGALGGYGWVTPVPGSNLLASVTQGVSWLTYSSPGQAPSYFYTEPVPVAAGQWVGSTYQMPSSGSGYHRATWEWLDAAGAVIAAPQSGYNFNGSATKVTHPAQQAPATATAVRLRFDIYADTAGTSPAPTTKFLVRDVTLAKAATSTQVTSLAFLAEPTWLNILGPTHSLKINREGLNVGSLTATVLDASLDPSKASTLRPGQRIRARVLVAGTWTSLYSGRLISASVTYSPLQPKASKRARIELTATDAVATLANVNRTEGVATITDLRHVLEGCGVPWNVNGSNQQIPRAVVVARNDNASALDQVAITRDSVRGFAWVDTDGVLNAFDAATLGATPTATISGSDYRADDGIDLSFDTDRCINEVTLQFVRINPSTGETEETTHGPYRDLESIRRWGTHTASYTVQGVTEAGLADYAVAILTANATPRVRALSAVLPIYRTADLAKTPVDLYDTLTVVSGTYSEALRVTGVSHEITPDKWLCSLAFDATSQVAPSQAVPSPSGGDGLTVAELLRPVGEVSMWFGVKTDCPAGWLVLDGATFDATTYPRLATLLGGSTLPNFEDRMPIGAGVKALGTSGGSPTAVLPTHAHPISGQAASATWSTPNTGTNTVPRSGGYNGHDHGGGTGPQEPRIAFVDTVPPWRALWFIIRAT